MVEVSIMGVYLAECQCTRNVRGDNLFMRRVVEQMYSIGSGKIGNTASVLVYFIVEFCLVQYCLLQLTVPIRYLYGWESTFTRGENIFGTFSALSV